MKTKYFLIFLLGLIFISCELPQEQATLEKSSALTISQEEQSVPFHNSVNLITKELQNRKYKIADLRAYFIDNENVKSIQNNNQSRCDIPAKIRCLLAGGKFDTARELLLSAISNNPENRKLLEILITLELLDENWESAIDLSSDALKSVPYDINFIEKKSISQFMLSDVYGALEGYDGIVRILNEYYPRKDIKFCDPLTQCCQDSDAKLLKAQSSIATVYYNMGDLDEAERLVREILAVKPDHIEAKFVLSLIMGKRDQISESMENYESILSLSPGNACVLNNMGVLFYRKKDLETALKYFETSYNNAGLNRRTKAIACANIADIYVLQGKYAEAEKKYYESAQISPRYAGVYFGLGELYDILGRDEEAMNNITHALALDPEGLNRFNSNFIEPEWEWQRDALIAEVQKDTNTAKDLWSKIFNGNVFVLKPTAQKHLNKSQK